MMRWRRFLLTASSTLAALWVGMAPLGCAGTEKKPDTPIAAQAEEQTAPPETPPPPPAAVAPAAEPASAEAADAAPAEGEEGATEEESAAPVTGPTAPPEEQLSSNSEARKDFEDAAAIVAADPARAMTLFERAARSDPSFVMAWHNAGVAAERQGKNNSAVAYYHEALKRRPDYQPSLFNLIQTYRRMGRPQDGEVLAQKALSQKRSAGSLAATGAAALAAGKYADAEKFAKQALKVDEKNVASMLVLAEAFHAQRKYELAKFVLTNANAISPSDALVLEALGRVYLALKNKPAALKNFEAAVNQRQDLVEAYNNLAVLYYELGDYSGSSFASQRAVELSPKLAAAWVNRGNALRAEKRYPEAIAAYQKAADLDKSQADAYYNLGILYLDNEVPNLDFVARMDLAGKNLAEYKGRARLRESDVVKVDGYITEADRLRQREVKNRERAIKRKAEEEAKKKADEEAKIKAEQDAKRQAEEAARKQAELAAKKQAEEAALARAIEEQKKKEEEAKKKKAEEEKKKKEEEAARQKALEEAKQRKISDGK